MHRGAPINGHVQLLHSAMMTDFLQTDIDLCDILQICSLYCSTCLHSHICLYGGPFIVMR